MFSFLLLHVCGFFINFFSAAGNGIELLPRYVLEEGFKSAIFGSYSYDPLSDKFEKDQGHESQQTDTTTTTDETTTVETTTESKNDTLFKLRHIVRRYSVKSKYIT
ncbi:PREDICTED: uncharacterized protein LOC106126153 [Papilio xuthus]|uniref:Uncharacterized protein LOC106126153 n=1 Tax=Papilio xuthus TaxID=66420 RepID=A0AAJ6ZTT1_PAPXU|nr:PREDICTED: uncharacterized protein LOC106126153 [Papilio xuthus]